MLILESAVGKGGREKKKKKKKKKTGVTGVSGRGVARSARTEVFFNRRLSV